MVAKVVAIAGLLLAFFTVLYFYTMPFVYKWWQEQQRNQR